MLLERQTESDFESSCRPTLWNGTPRTFRTVYLHYPYDTIVKFRGGPSIRNILMGCRHIVFYVVFPMILLHAMACVTRNGVRDTQWR